MMALHSGVFISCTSFFGQKYRLEEREAMGAHCSMKAGRRKKEVRRNRKCLF